MKKYIVMILSLLFIVLSFASDSYIYYGETIDNNELLNYPLFIQFGDTRLFIGDENLNNRFKTDMPKKTTDTDIYFAGDMDGKTLEKLGSAVRLLYVEGPWVIFNSDESTVNRILDLNDKNLIIEKVEFPFVVYEKFRPSRDTQKENVINIIEKVSLENIKDVLKKLVDYKTRYSFSPIYKDVAEDMKELLSSYGYDVRLEEFSSYKGRSWNVIAEKKGNTDKKILVVGHMDSTSPQIKTLAPGADDNGSGTTGVIEMARILKDVELEHTVEFILFSGEENGLLGSKDYAEKHVEDGNIEYVINMDMIGFYKNNKDVLFMESYSSCKDFMNVIAQAASTYAGFEIEMSFRPFGSDHMPFLYRNVPAVLTIEKDWDANHNYHQITDTYETVKFDYIERVVKTNTAALLELDK